MDLKENKFYSTTESGAKAYTISDRSKKYVKKEKVEPKKEVKNEIPKDEQGIRNKGQKGEDNKQSIKDEKPNEKKDEADRIFQSEAQRITKEIESIKDGENPLDVSKKNDKEINSLPAELSKPIKKKLKDKTDKFTAEQESIKLEHEKDLKEDVEIKEEKDKDELSIEKSKIVDKPELEYPVHGIKIEGENKYFQKADTNYGIEWFEVRKDKSGSWQSVDSKYAGASTKAEAIENTRIKDKSVIKGSDVQKIEKKAKSETEEIKPSEITESPKEYNKGDVVVTKDGKVFNIERQRNEVGGTKLKSGEQRVFVEGQTRFYNKSYIDGLLTKGGKLIDKKTIKGKANDLAEKIRKHKIIIPKGEAKWTGRNPSVQFIPFQAELYNLAVEGFAKAVENSASIAEAIKQGLKAINNRKSKYYKGLSRAQREAVRRQFKKVFTLKDLKAEVEEVRNLKGLAATVTTDIELRKSKVNLSQNYRDMVNSIKYPKAVKTGERKAILDIKDIKDGINDFINKNEAGLKTLPGITLKSIIRAVNSKGFTVKQADRLIEKMGTAIQRQHRKNVKAEVRSTLIDIEKQIKSRKLKKTKPGKEKKGAIDVWGQQYLDQAKLIFTKYKNLIESKKELDKINLIDKKLSEDEINERIKDDQSLLDEWNEFIKLERAFIESEKLSYNKNTQERAINKEVALIDLERLFRASPEELFDILQNVRRTVDESAKTLREKIDADTKLRNEKKVKYRESTTVKDSDKSDLDIQQLKGADPKTIIGKGLRKASDFIESDPFLKTISPTANSLDFLLKYIERGVHRAEQGPIWKTLFRGENGYFISNGRRIKAQERHLATMNNAYSKFFGLSNKESFINKIKKDNFFVDAKAVVESGITLPIMNSNLRLEQLKSKAQALDIWLRGKNPDSRLKYMEQGWDNIAWEQLESFLGKDFLNFGEWLSTEYMPELHKRYNELSKEVNFTELPYLEGFWPNKYDNAFGGNEINKNNPNDLLPSVSSSHLISRISNKHNLTTTSSAFDVLNEYVSSTDNWYHFKKFERDANILFTDPVIKNNLQKQGLYDILLESVKNTLGSSVNPSASLSAYHQGINYINQNIALTHVGFKVWTAFKQGASSPAVLGDLNNPALGAVNMVKAAKDLNKNFRFFYDNMPTFRQRLRERSLGMEELSDLANQEGKREVTVRNTAAKSALKLNSYMDIRTIVISGKPMYDERYKLYRDLGFSSSKAKSEALVDTEIWWNQTQQSSVSGFRGPAQFSKGLSRPLFVTYQNANFGYFRKILTGHMNIVGDFGREYQRKLIAEHASGKFGRVAELRAAAKTGKQFKKKETWNDLRKIFIYGHLLPSLWTYLNLGLPGIATQWDDEDTAGMVIGTVMGPLRGVYAVGPLISAYASGYEYLPGVMIPFMRDSYKAIVDAFNSEEKHSFVLGGNIVKASLAVAVEAGVGVKPETFERMYLGALDITREEPMYGKGMLEIVSAPKPMIREMGYEYKPIATDVAKSTSLLDFRTKIIKKYSKEHYIENQHSYANSYYIYKYYGLNDKLVNKIYNSHYTQEQKVGFLKDYYESLGDRKISYRSFLSKAVNPTGTYTYINSDGERKDRDAGILINSELDKLQSEFSKVIGSDKYK